MHELHEHGFHENLLHGVYFWMNKLMYIVLVDKLDRFAILPTLQTLLNSTTNIPVCTLATETS